MPTKLVFVLGTRPEIIKLAPLIRACERRDVPFALVHTGQHYSDSLDEAFFRDLELPEPDHNLGVGSASHGRQTGRMLVELDETLDVERPDVVVVQGDTNSTLAGALVASKRDCELAHVEAGLRSDDREMPEELNRILVDHAGDWLFAPTTDAARRLRDEGISADRVAITGNTIVDAVLDHRQLAAEKSDALSAFGVEPDGFALLTAHRPRNVDDRDRFERLLTGVARCCDRLGLDAVYPIHPRARERLDTFGLTVPDPIDVVEPLNFLDFLRLESTAALVFTDSGGVQEEACVLETPCVTLRENTERPETLAVGSNVLVGANPSRIVECGREMYRTDTDWTPPFGDGDAALRILEELGVATAPTVEQTSR